MGAILNNETAFGRVRGKWRAGKYYRSLGAVPKLSQGWTALSRGGLELWREQSGGWWPGAPNDLIF